MTLRVTITLVISEAILSNSSYISFGEHLKSELAERKLSISDAAKIFGVSTSVVVMLIGGDTTYEWIHISDWLSLLEVPDKIIRSYRSLYMDEQAVKRYEIDGYTFNFTDKRADSIIGLQKQITEISSALANISKQVQEREVVERIVDGPDSLSDELQALTEKVGKLEVTGDKLTAQVEVPTPDRMKVKLVPSTLIAQIEEYRSDSVIWYSLAGAFGGAVLGVYVNWATGGELTSSANVLTIIFILLMIVFVVLIRRNEKRLEVAKSLMLGIDMTPLHYLELRKRSERAMWAHNLVERFLGGASNDSDTPTRSVILNRSDESSVNQ